MTIKAKDCPQNRSKILSSFRSPVPGTLIHQMLDGREKGYVDFMVRTSGKILLNSTLYLFTDEPASVLRDNFMSFPDEATVDPSAVPQRGLVFFSNGLELFGARVDAIMWSFTEGKFIPGIFTMSDSGVWDIPKCTEPSGSPENILKLGPSLASMIATPGLFSTHTPKMSNKQAKKKTKREIDTSAVRVISLRGRTSSCQGTNPGTPMRHRFVVKGHWRQQPYGPGSSLRRATFISPHLKGPEGAPLLTGEKVYTL